VRVGRSGKDHYELVGPEPSVDANRFLTALRVRGLSPRTTRAYAFDLLWLYRWLLASNRRVDDLVAADLVDFIAEQQRSGAAPRSINRRLMTVRLFFRFCFDREIDRGPGILRPGPHYRGPGRDHDLGLHRLHRRPLRHVRVKVPRLLVEPLTPEEVRAFIRSLRRYRDLAIVHLMLLCGLRSREVLELGVDDVVWSDRQLRVRGKGQRDRALPLPDVVANALREYLHLERPHQANELRLFLVMQGRRRGQPMTLEGLRSLFRHRRRGPTLAKANAHRFRHTFGTDMARAGVRLPILQRMMGHADMKTTMQYIELSLVDVADEYRRAMATLETRYRSKRSL
jgi:site-specific recombinase XerD